MNEEEKESIDAKFEEFMKKEELPKIIIPDGLDTTPEVKKDNLNNHLEELFAKAKQKADQKESIDTKSVDTGDFVTVQLPNGMEVKVHKKSHKSKAEDMARLFEAAEKLECSDTDEDGNAINHEQELAKLQNEPAKSDYKAGMLRDLKTQFYPQDNSGKEAQERLDNRDEDAIEEEVYERFRKQTNAVDNANLWAALRAIAEGIRADRERNSGEQLREDKKQPRSCLIPPNKRVAKLWEEKPLSMFSIDWDRFTDPDFIEKVNSIIAAPKHRVQITDELSVNVPDGISLDGEKMRIALSAAKNEAGEKRERQTAEKREKIAAERRVVELERERIRKLTDDIIPISPIENPSLVRRLIRTIRRTWQRVKNAKHALRAWWRL